MNRIIALVAGPELCWLLLYGLTALLIRRNQPPTPAGSEQLEWIRKNAYLVMKVPSVHSPFESNFLINPLHEQARLLSIVEVIPLEFDQRLKDNTEEA